jgi:hypothetical protein
MKIYIPVDTVVVGALGCEILIAKDPLAFSDKGFLN